MIVKKIMLLCGREDYIVIGTQEWRLILRGGQRIFFSFHLRKKLEKYKYTIYVLFCSSLQQQQQQKIIHVKTSLVVFSFLLNIFFIFWSVGVKRIGWRTNLILLPITRSPSMTTTPSTFFIYILKILL